MATRKKTAKPRKAAAKKAPAKKRKPLTPAQRAAISKKSSQKRNPAKTDKSKKIFIEALGKALGIVSSACKLSGLSRAQVYKWRKDDEAFAAAMDDTDNIAIDFAEQQLMKNIKSGKEASCIFFLKCRAKARGYVEKQEIEVTSLPSLVINLQKGETK